MAEGFAREEPDEVALLDGARLERLRTDIPDQLGRLIKDGIADAERACECLRNLPVGSEDIVREAHSLKGSSGMLGMRRVSQLAGDIEAGARDGTPVADLIAELKETVIATRAEPQILAATIH